VVRGYDSRCNVDWREQLDGDHLHWCSEWQCIYHQVADLARSINNVAFDGSADITVADGTKLPTAGGTLTGQLVSTRANNTGDGQGQIYINGADASRIDFGPNGASAPSTTSRSLGTKIVLYPQVDGGQTDYAIGLESAGIWFSVANNSNTQFRWYGGTTVAATLSGGGNLSVTGTITAGDKAVQRGLANASTASGETALFVSPNTVRTLKAGNGIALSTASDVVSARYAPHAAVRVASGFISGTVNVGQVTPTLAARTTGTAYVFTLPTAHPLGADYTLTVTPTTFIVCSAVVTSSTQFSVFCRNTSGTLIDGDFYVQTVP